VGIGGHGDIKDARESPSGGDLPGKVIVDFVGELGGHEEAHLSLFAAEAIEARGIAPDGTLPLHRRRPR
jgi:hypothetical protein